MQMMRNGHVNGMDLVQEPFILRVIFQQFIRFRKPAHLLLVASVNGRYFNAADVLGLLEKTARYAPVAGNSHVDNEIPGGTEVG